jgi:hypothetical protein
MTQGEGRQPMSGDYIDIPVGGGGSFEDLKALAAGTDREAILKAANALKRGEAGPGHLADLWAAVARFRGSYIQAFERAGNAYIAGSGTLEGLNEHLAGQREELGALFRADLEAVIAEARDGLAGGRA